MIASLNLVRVAIASVALVIAPSCGGDGARFREAERMLERAAGYLWSQQAADGGWHSEVHGVMRTGQTLTPYILHSLMDIPVSVHDPDSSSLNRALNFLRTTINARGILGLADPDIIEYPNYSTAYALRVLTAYGGNRDSSLISLMRRYLEAEQFTEQRGIGATHPAYGSWGFGETNLQPGRVGHVDLSHTRHVLEALRSTGWADTAALTAVRRFLRLVQKHPSHEFSPRAQYDGGFYFSPVVPDQNKAGRDSAAFRSYATATCGGIMALLAAGEPVAGEPVQAARRWLELHPELDFPAGIPDDDPSGWRKVLFFYHLSVRAEVYAALEVTGGWRDEIVRLLRGRQREDGSFANPHGAPNKEDDPLLATALVIRTLTNVIRPAR